MADRILLVKLADLGDLLLCEPAVRSLRAANPNARFDLLAYPHANQLARALWPDIELVSVDGRLSRRGSSRRSPRNVLGALALARELRSRQYTKAVLFHHLTTARGATRHRALAKAIGAPVVGLDNGRGGFLARPALDYGFGVEHEAEYMLDIAIAAEGVPVDPMPRFPNDACARPEGLPDRYATIHPVTGPYSTAREWSIDNWITVAAKLSEAGLTPVIVGATDAADAAKRIRAAHPAAIDLTGRTTIAQLAGTLRDASCALGCDSFVGHLAAAVGAPTVSVFGPSNDRAWRPFGPPGRHRVVSASLPCQPCLYTGFSLGRPEGCPDRTCLRFVTPDMVVSEALNVARNTG